MVLVFVGSMLFAVLQPITVLPRIRLAPGYALTDQAGDRVTSEDARGTVTLYSFASLDCDDACTRSTETMRAVLERRDEIDLGDVELRLVTIVTDADPATVDVEGAAAAAGADGTSWRWLHGSQADVRNVVGYGFERRLDGGDVPGFVIVDGAGTIRGDYRYRTLAADDDKLIDHLGMLGSEIRNDSGFRGLAFDAAHLFSCYP